MQQTTKKIVLSIFLLSFSTLGIAHSNHHHPVKQEEGKTLNKIQKVELILKEARSKNDQNKYREAKTLLDEMGKTVKVRLYLAEIQQYFHNFDSALSTLAPIKNNSSSGLLKASIYFTQGKVKRAHHECMKLFGAIDNLVAMTCLAQANSLLGQLDKAYGVLHASMQHMQSDNKQSQAWAYVTLAEMAERKSDTESARRFYQKALALNKNDYPSRIAYADLLLEEKNYSKVTAITKDYLNNDLIMLRYVRALNIQGDLRTSDHFCELKRRVLNYIGTSNYSKQNQHLHYDLIAEYFLYFSADSELALNWAKKHWHQQKTPRDARLLLKAAIEANDDAVIEEVKHWQGMFQTEDKRQQALFKDTILAWNR